MAITRPRPDSAFLCIGSLHCNEMGTRALVVSEVPVENQPQVPLADDSYAVQASLAERADRPLDVWVLPWRLAVDDHLSDAHYVQSLAKPAGVDSVAVTNEEVGIGLRPGNASTIC